MVMAHPNVRWPDPNQAWEMPQTGHIDGYGGRWLPLMLVATAYLYDIQTYPGRAAESPSSSPRQIAEKKDRPSTCPSRSASSPPPSRSNPCRLGDFALLGELSLNGGVRPIHGMLSKAASLHEEGLYGMIIPTQNAREAASKIDVGTTFRLHIPLTRSPETPAS